MIYKDFLILLLLSACAFETLANCYDQTRSAQENYLSCRRAAEEGDSMAQYFVGQMYRKGDGVEKNPEEAVRWYRQAAAQQNQLALFNLAWMYDSGEGVEHSPQEAIAWYAKAARMGDPYAPFNIGTLYFNGRDLPRDPENALFWFAVARANGNEKATKWYDKIAEHLPSEQLDRVQTRLDQWSSEAANPETE
ncbi:MAG: tetratricopeptide repeat protein [Gammaproteobacteria bacterium]